VLVNSYRHLGSGYWSIFKGQGLLTPEDEIEEVTWYGQHVLGIFMWYMLVINFMLPMEQPLIILKSQFVIYYKIYLIIYVRGCPK